MLDAPFRRLLPRFTGELVATLARWQVHPDLLSWGGALLALGAAGLVATGHGWPGYAVWLASRLLDGLDGQLARATGRGTPFGGYLDIVLDMLAYGAMVLAFAARHPAHPALWLAVLLGYLLVTTSTLALSSLLEALRARNPGNDRSLQFTPGLAEAGETSIAYGLFIAWPGAIAPLGWTWVVVLALTVVQRGVLAWRLLRIPSEAS